MTEKTTAQTFYVVTRDKRRTEDKNYLSKEDAEFRAEKLRAVLRTFDPQDVKKVSVVSTKTPNKIR